MRHRPGVAMGALKPGGLEGEEATELCAPDVVVLADQQSHRVGFSGGVNQRAPLRLVESVFILQAAPHNGRMIARVEDHLAHRLRQIDRIPALVVHPA